MEIDIARCKKLDKMHDYQYSKAHVSAHGGFHARCGKSYLAGVRIKNIATGCGSNQFCVKSAIVNLGLADKSFLTNYQPWTEKEIKELKEMVAQNIPANMIAIKFNRNLNSIRGILNRHKKGKPFFKKKCVDNYIQPKKAFPKTCSCGAVFVSLNDQCNWCWGKNGSDRVAK